MAQRKALLKNEEKEPKRITVKVPDLVHREIRFLALKYNITITQLVINALCDYIEERGMEGLKYENQ